jgi:hypothetical protein
MSGIAIPIAFALLLTSAHLLLLRGCYWVKGIYALLHYSIALLLYTFLITHFSGDLFGADPGITLTAAYDHQAQSFLEGRADIPASVIQWEAFYHDGNVVMYFGPFPAFVRMLLTSIWPEMFGLWARILALSASCLWLLAYGLASEKLSQALAPQRGLHQLLFSSMFFGLALGTPLFFLLSANTIYHEAILWGVGFELLTLSLLCVGTQTGALKVLLLSTLAGSALLSRVTCGLPLVLALSCLALWRVITAKGRHGRAALQYCAALVPLVVAVLIMGAVNNQRFGSPYKAFDFAQYQHSISHQIEHAQEISLFSLQRLPEALSLYFWPQAGALSSQFPFVKPVHVRHSQPGLFFFDWSEFTLPFPLLSGTLILGALCALALSKKIWASAERAVVVFFGPCFFLQAFLLQLFFAVSYRYSAEFVPVLLFSWCLLKPATHAPSTPRTLVIVFGFLILGLWSAVVSVPAALAWTLTQWAVPAEFHEILRSSLLLILGEIPEWALKPPL